MSWVSIHEANEYLSAGLSASQWLAADETLREQALVTAWRSIVADPAYSFPDQPTGWMKSAQIELALFFITQPDAAQALQLATSGVASFTIGKFSMALRSDAEMIEGRSPFPPIVIALLSGYRNLSILSSSVTARSYYR